MRQTRQPAPGPTATSSLIDGAWYLEAYPDVSAQGVDPVEHYVAYGAAEGRWPNPYFDPDWYRNNYAEVPGCGMDALQHYLHQGERRDFQPIEYFDTAWYRRRYGVGAEGCPLAHFLARRCGGEVSPLPEFDAAWYLRRHPDIAAAGIDPFRHYLFTGYCEGRDPSPDFDTESYRRRYLEDHPQTNPLLHYRRFRATLVLKPLPSRQTCGVIDEVRRFTRPGPDFEAVDGGFAHGVRRAKLLAFYLPQFHATPENNEWWGVGFTEWTALARGVPRFAGHYQPRTPRDLGHYTLGDTAIMHRQIEMARGAGLHGFIFYFYWFDGRRLLDAPLEAWIADRTLDFPFCLMWANENWTRRWDGSEDEVLIAQRYDPARDAALIDCFARHFRDPRYIRLQGRPLLFVYRADVIPETAATLRRWRGLFRDRHGEDPVLVMAQTFDRNDPRDFEFDAAAEFPPHKVTVGLHRCNDGLTLHDPAMTGNVFEYEDVVAASLAEADPPFPLLKTVAPGWDNDARRQGAGMALRHAKPHIYESWLRALVTRAAARPVAGEPIVCINAWNEWAEGAYLEPDVHCGGAFLNATARALAAAGTWNGRLLLVGHDAFAAGAQYLLLHLLRYFRSCCGVQVETLLLDGGPLAAAYEAEAPCITRPDEPSQAIRQWAARGFAKAIVNTCAAGHMVTPLRRAGFDVTLLVHEMPGLLREKQLVERSRKAAAAADRLVFADPVVASRFAELVSFGIEKQVILPQGAYHVPITDPSVYSLTRFRQRQALGIGAERLVVLGTGYGDLRKGFDLFLQAWHAARRTTRDAHFCWLGDIDPTVASYLGPDIEAAEATGTFLVASHQHPVAPWYAAADVFALSSREDPFPSVVLEAIKAGLPVVAFECSGGIPELLRRHSCGEAVKMGDAAALGEGAIRLAIRFRKQRARRQLNARPLFDFDAYGRALLRRAAPEWLTVSVVVPSFNYARYMPARLRSVFAQTYPLAEVIVLDDASTDASVAVALEVAAACGRRIRVHTKVRNAGSAFAQWHLAASMAQGEYVWIAEADDVADPTLLAELAARLAGAADIDLAFCDSRAIDESGAPIWPDYKGYYAQHHARDLFVDQTFEARVFARRFLAARNMILNVSAVLWRRSALLAALERCQTAMRVARAAGDWRLYIEVLAESDGRIAYVARPLNAHRRHGDSVTQRTKPTALAKEVGGMHRLINARLNPPALVRREQARFLREIRRGAVGTLGQRRHPELRGRSS